MFVQIAKFLLIGGFNTLIDLGVLNILILATGITSGLGFSLFKGTSFLAAVLNSYFWNKRWTFRSQKDVFLQFFTISAIGFVLNVGAASLVVNVLTPQFGLSEQLWANVGAITGTLVVMTWNFLGYKFIVFKK
ncbi:GtrA family protein [Patescibacteria group bacterium]|nr:GtrA family protein [Patescibacteria group bacterium]